jgi:hypothetical protein
VVPDDFDRRLTIAQVPPHLWIESCTLRGFPLRLSTLRETQNGLQSLRLRRLRLANHFDGRVSPYRYARAGTINNLHNGIGSTYETTTDSGPLGSWELVVSPEMLAKVPTAVKWLNERTYDALPEANVFLSGARDWIPYPVSGRNPSLRQQEALWTDTIGIITSSSFETLRSINLDWILTPKQSVLHWESYQHFERLSKLRFPNLRALQLRNAVTDNTKLAPSIYLLEPMTCVTSTDATRFADDAPRAQYVSLQRHSRTGF